MLGLGHNGTWEQRGWGMTGLVTTDWGVLGMEHNRTGAHWDYATKGLGHNGTGAQRDWGMTGLGTMGLGHNGIWAQRD